jgi:hypothetical protein
MKNRLTQRTRWSRERSDKRKTKDMVRNQRRIHELIKKDGSGRGVANKKLPMRLSQIVTK